MNKYDIIVESDESMRFAIFLVNYVAGDAQLDRQYLEGCHPEFWRRLEERERVGVVGGGLAEGVGRGLRVAGAMREQQQQQ